MCFFFVILNPIGIVFADSNAGSIASYTFGIIENADPVHPVPIKYEKFELQVNWNGSDGYSNPFDPDEISLWAIFAAPSGMQWTIPGFWDGSEWRVRFSPNEVGRWSYYVKVDDYSGTNKSGVSSFECSPSDIHGWLKVSDNDPHYLQYADGTSFFGIGHNRCWELDQLGWTLEGGYQLIADMEAHGMNILGFWMAPWDTQIVTMASGYDRYDMDRADELDTILSDAAQHNVYLVLAIWSHCALRCDGHPWPRHRWYTENPFSDFLGTKTTCDDFFTDATMWEYQKKLYRCTIARWGFSWAVGVWQTVVGIEGTGSSSDVTEDKNIWHENSYQLFQE